MNPTPQPHLEELDLAIANLDFPTLERELLALLQDMPGIRSVRVQEQGALIQYNPMGTSKEQIVSALRQAGYRTTIFQDSASGQTGTVDY